MPRAGLNTAEVVAAGAELADEIDALFTAVESYIVDHLGRYGATTGAQFLGDDEPLLAAAKRVIASVLSGYRIQPEELDHAIRMLRCMIHGYALLQASNAFQWGNDLGESVRWMIRFVEAGLIAVGKPTP